VTRGQVIRAYRAVYERNADYGTLGPRLDIFVEFLQRHVPAGGSVCDFGCGRGVLVRRLRELGYDASGTEVLPELIANDCAGLPVRELWYSDLGTVPDGAYDAVVSSDVLEHLESEDAARAALGHLVRIARKALVLSIGLKRSHPKGTPAEFNGGELHTLLRPREWWLALLAPYGFVAEQPRLKKAALLALCRRPG